MECHDRRRRQAAIPGRSVWTRKPHRVDGFSVLRFMGRRSQCRLVAGQRARSLVDPDVVVWRDIQASDLSDDPVVGKLLGPAGVSDEARHFSGRRHTVHAGPLGKPLQNAGRSKRLIVGLRCLGLACLGYKHSQQHSTNGKQFQIHTHSSFPHWISVFSLSRAGGAGRLASPTFSFMAQENRPIIQPARFFINGILSSPEETKRPTGVMEYDVAWKASCYPARRSLTGKAKRRARSKSCFPPEMYDAAAIKRTSPV